MPEQNVKWLKWLQSWGEQPVLVSTAKCSAEWEQSLLLVCKKRLTEENVMNACLADSAGSHESSDNMSFLVGWRPLASPRMKSEIRNAVPLLRSPASAHSWKWSASHPGTLHTNSPVASFMQAHYTVSAFLYLLLTHTRSYLLLKTLTVMGRFCWMVCVYGKRA